MHLFDWKTKCIETEMTRFSPINECLSLFVTLLTIVQKAKIQVFCAKYIRKYREIDNEVQRLKLLKASYDSQRYGLQDNYMIRFPKLIKAAEEKLACVEEDVKARDAELIRSAEFAIKVKNVMFTERTDGGASMLEAISKCKTGETSSIGSFRGFELLVEKNFMGINYLVLRGMTDYKVELSTSPVGNMVKLENLFNGIQENVEYLEKKIE